MCGEKKSTCTKEKAPEPADRWHSGRMDRAGPLCGLVNYEAKRYADRLQKLYWRELSALCTTELK